MLKNKYWLAGFFAGIAVSCCTFSVVVFTAACATTTAPDGTRTTTPPSAAEIAAYEALAIQAANEGITIKQALDASKAKK